MSQKIIVIFMSSLFISGCQVVSVKNQKVNVTIANERDSILSGKQLSEASLNVLSMTGLDPKHCIEQPSECVAEIKAIPEITDEQYLSTASELYLAKAISYEKSSECKSRILNKSKSRQEESQEKYDTCLNNELEMLDQSIRYSYAYLFKTQRQLEDRIFDNRQVQIRDFYNLAIANFSTAYSALYKQGHNLPANFQVGQSHYHLNLDPYDKLDPKKIESFEATYNLNFSGLRSIIRRDGFGSEFLIVLKNDSPLSKKEKTDYIVDPLNYAYPKGVNPNLHSARYLSATVTAEPVNATSVEEILTTPNFQLNIYNPYDYSTVKVANHEYPLAANFSAPYGTWLAENNLGKEAYLSLIDRDARLTMPHLFMLEPYNPNKKVIVLVHGLASSPEAWIRLTNDIMGDKVLRDHYQVWQVFYSTNMPILESRYQIYALITQAFNLVDPKDSAKHDAILIGHSMGGIIARLLVSQDNLIKPAKKLTKNNIFFDIHSDPVIQERLEIKPIPNFSRAVFLSAPHRGTAFADRWFTLAARKIIKLPGAFLGAVADTVQADDANFKGFVKDMNNSLLQNGPSDLSKNSKFTQLTENVVPRTGFKYHSIIGNSTNSQDPNVMTDGIVPYKSAHLDGALTEKIIHGGHSIQETPQAVLELRRLLRLHLKELK